MNAPSPFRGKSTLPPLHPSLAKLDPDPNEKRYALEFLCARNHAIDKRAKPQPKFMPTRKVKQTPAPRGSSRKAILTLMADGRERTAKDVSYRLGKSESNTRTQLGRLADAGLLKRSWVMDTAIYRIAEIG